MELKLIAPLHELARRLRVPARWLREEADAGRIPHVRAGAQRLFNIDVVERVLAQRAASGHDSGVESEEAARGA
jgi:excisionase family DNA binding protein